MRRTTSFISLRRAARQWKTTVELDAERAEKDPKFFTHIHMHFVLKGRGLAPAKVQRAIDLSVEKYCSASAMLARTATITHDFEVEDTAATAQEVTLPNL
jgi:putative redox protein